MMLNTIFDLKKTTEKENSFSTCIPYQEKRRKRSTQTPTKRAL
jgi:hypothetical protein